MHRLQSFLPRLASTLQNKTFPPALPSNPLLGVVRLMSQAAEGGPVYTSIVNKLTTELQPTEIELIDDSASHRGHAGMKGKDAIESHFKLKIVSDKFEGLPLVQRHQLVYGLLTQEFDGGLHALNIKAKTPKEIAK